MFSLDNLYYILYMNLLKPANIRESMFYPFGTNTADDIIVDYYHKLYNKYSFSKVMTLFYDQEPISKQVTAEFFNRLQHNIRWNISPVKVSDDVINRLGREKYQNCLNNFGILANSEHSTVKEEILKEFNFRDWYYFFHGFAVLDWYRDYQYIPVLLDRFTKVFMCLNRLVTKDRSYRLYLISSMLKQDLVKYGNVSLILEDNGGGTWQTELQDPASRLSDQAKVLINEQIGRLPGSLIVDNPNPLGSASADAGPNELLMLQSSLWHVVPETVFYHDKLHLTEKIFKPIVARRPFILVGAPGNLAYLKSYGFKTFDRWIDESYDTVIDHELRMDMIVSEVNKLCSLSIPELEQMHREMSEVLEYNFNHLYGDFKVIIIDELLTNFKRIIPESPINYSEVKNRLLR